MIPYDGLDYFLLIGLAMLPMMIAGAKGRVNGWWTLAATVAMLAIQYSPKIQITHHLHWPEWIPLLVDGGFLWLVVRLALKKRLPGGSLAAIPLGLAPLIVSKAVILSSGDCRFGFVGISYVTFRALDLLWAITDGAVVEVAFADFVLFLFFFPTISSGPIDRFRRFQKDWRRQRTSTEFWTDFDAGLPLFFRGLLYKFVIDAIIAGYFLIPAKAMPGFWGGVAYAYVFSFHLFFDFAGYTALALGVSRWFGIHSPPNFHLPWAAQNIRDFWNRWHMSLSFWFRDHVYTRFLLSAVRGKWFKKRETAGQVGYFVSFGLMGLWHGTEAFYLLYGLYHAILMAGYDVFVRWKKRRPGRLSHPLWKWPAHFLTIQAVVFGLWLFSGVAWETPKPPASPEPPAGNNVNNPPIAEPGNVPPGE